MASEWRATRGAPLIIGGAWDAAACAGVRAGRAAAPRIHDGRCGNGSVSRQRALLGGGGAGRRERTRGSAPRAERGREIRNNGRFLNTMSAT